MRTIIPATERALFAGLLYRGALGVVVVGVVPDEGLGTVGDGDDLNLLTQHVVGHEVVALDGREGAGGCITQVAVRAIVDTAIGALGALLDIFDLVLEQAELQIEMDAVHRAQEKKKRKTE